LKALKVVPISGMFVFELKIRDNPDSPKIYLSEFQLAILIRILKSRNEKLYTIFNDYYTKVSETCRW
jgi:hypothetical protein